MLACSIWYPVREEAPQCVKSVMIRGKKAFFVLLQAALLMDCKSLPLKS